MLRRDIRYQAAILRGDRLLLLRVVERDGATYWLPPGGGREADESAEACVCREILEETSLVVEVERLLFTEPAPPGDGYDRIQTYLCRIRSGAERPGVEPETDTPDHASIQETGWFDLRDPAAWPSLILTDSITYPWLQKLRAALGYA